MKELIETEEEYIEMIKSAGLDPFIVIEKKKKITKLLISNQK